MRDSRAMSTHQRLAVTATHAVAAAHTDAAYYMRKSATAAISRSP